MLFPDPESMLNRRTFQEPTVLALPQALGFMAGSPKPWVSILPSGSTYKKLLKMAIEIVDFPIKNGGSFQFAM
jgi:hypothetical protein